MRRSLFLTFLILVIGAGWHAWNLRRLAALESQAGPLPGGGVPANEKPVKEPRSTDSNLAGRKIATEKLAVPEGGNFAEELRSLDLDGLQACLAELQRSGDTGSDATLYAVAAVIEAIMDRNPQAALNQLTKRRAPGITRQMQARYAPEALRHWAAREPEKTAAWLDAALASDRDTFGKDTLRSLGRSLAGVDPALVISALQKHLGPEEMMAVVSIPRGPDGPRESDFAATRSYVESLPEGELKALLEGRIYQQLSQAIGVGKFESITPWLENCQPGEPQLRAFVNGLAPHELGGDSGKWIAWIGDRLGTDAIQPQVRSLMEAWTRADPQAAGTWLAAAADNAAKTPAVQAFAETVAQFEPRIAEQWALILPEGEDRQTTLQDIYDRWPREDAQGRDAFRKKHGLR